MSAMRFGRRLPIPSTRQIRHELIVMMNEEARAKELKQEAVDAEAARIARESDTPIPI